jgi:hypothetical protein
MNCIRDYESSEVRNELLYAVDYSQQRPYGVKWVCLPPPSDILYELGKRTNRLKRLDRISRMKVETALNNIMNDIGQMVKLTECNMRDGLQLTRIHYENGEYIYDLDPKNLYMCITNYNTKSHSRHSRYKLIGLCQDAKSNAYEMEKILGSTNEATKLIEINLDYDAMRGNWD